MNDSENWYIIQQEDNTCAIVAEQKEPSENKEIWGPFPSQAEAIAKRVGLIRSGKCKPQ